MDPPADDTTTRQPEIHSQLGTQLGALGPSELV
jgi:hypothetical protein